MTRRLGQRIFYTIQIVGCSCSVVITIGKDSRKEKSSPTNKALGQPKSITSQEVNRSFEEIKKMMQAKLKNGRRNSEVSKLE